MDTHYKLQFNIQILLKILLPTPTHLWHKQGYTHYKSQSEVHFNIELPMLISVIYLYPEEICCILI